MKLLILIIFISMSVFGCAKQPIQYQEVQVSVEMTNEMVSELAIQIKEELKTESACSKTLFDTLLEIEEVDKAKFKSEGDIVGYTKQLKAKIKEYRNAVDQTAHKFGLCNQ